MNEAPEMFSSIAINVEASNHGSRFYGQPSEFRDSRDIRTLRTRVSAPQRFTSIPLQLQSADSATAVLAVTTSSRSATSSATCSQFGSNKGLGTTDSSAVPPVVALQDCGLFSTLSSCISHCRPLHGADRPSRHVADVHQGASSPARLLDPGRPRSPHRTRWSGLHAPR